MPILHVNTGNVFLPSPSQDLIPDQGVVKVSGSFEVLETCPYVRVVALDELPVSDFVLWSSRGDPQRKSMVRPCLLDLSI